MSTTPVTNPKTFTITDPTLTADNVTGFQVLFGRATGGPYTVIVPVPPADIDAATGIVTGAIAALETSLAPGAWFAVAEAVNATGASQNSPEAAILLVPPLPAAPTGFSVA